MSAQQKPHYTTAEHPSSKMSIRAIVAWISLIIAAVFALTGAYFWGASNASVTQVEILIPTPAPVIVQVVGEVRAPGVYKLNAQDRVLTAIELAGGTTEYADIQSTNLAAVVKDGSRIFVPRIPPTPIPQIPIQTNNDNTSDDTTTVHPNTPTQTPSQVVKKQSQIDLNSATIEELISLPGIGQTRANQIIEHRNAVGRFSALEQLLEINGIGEKTIEAIRPLVVIQ